MTPVLSHGFGNQSGGESMNRNAVMFEFSQPVAAFGAWFGDLETRTNNGTPAILRLIDQSGNVIGEDTIIHPDYTFLADNNTSQSDCGGANSSDIVGCGNKYHTLGWFC